MYNFILVMENEAIANTNNKLLKKTRKRKERSPDTMFKLKVELSWV